MYLLVVLGAIAVVVVAGLFIMWWMQDSKQKSLEQERQHEAAVQIAEVERALAGDPEAEAAVYAAWKGHGEEKSYFLDVANHYVMNLKQILSAEQFERIKNHCLKMYLRRDYEKYFPRVQGHYDKWRSHLAEGNFLDAYKAGVELRDAFAFLDEETNRDQAAKELELADDGISVKQLTDLVQEHIQQLWEQAQEDVAAYFTIQQLIRQAWQRETVRTSEVRFRKQPQLRLYYPKGWRQKTAEHLDQPCLSDFAVREFAPGEGLRRAVQVLMYDGDWVEAAIVLAHSNSSKSAMLEVGPELRRELQERVLAARHVSAATSTPTTD